MTIPAVLCIDVEPDLRTPPVPSSEHWTGFERFLEDLERLRVRLAEPTGRQAQLGWFLRMDPQVEVAHGTIGWVADRYGAELAALSDAGDELGLHPHSWRWEADHWCSDQSPDWVAHCANAALDAFQTGFGRPCRSYRHGDRFTSPALVDLLQARGVRCDVGLEPGRPAVPGLVASEASVGHLPAVPEDWVQPFVARVGDREADHLLMLPLTSSFDPGLAADDAQFATLLLWSPPHTFAALLDARLAGGDLRHLAFAVRSDIALSCGLLELVEQNLAVLGARLGTDLEWVTPSEARRRLLPEAVGGGGPSPVWPRSLSDDALRSVVHRMAVQLQAEEASRSALQQRSDATAVELEAALQAAQAEMQLLRSSERELRAELATVRGTATWRLHQRLLPLLRAVRRLFKPRGG